MILETSSAYKGRNQRRNMVQKGKERTDEDVQQEDNNEAE